MSVDIERLKVDADYWDEVAPMTGAKYYCPRHRYFLVIHCGCFGSIPRPTKPEWVDGLPPDSIAEFRKALALNLQNSIEAITGEAFGDDDSLILAHEMMVKYDISDKLKYTGD